MQEFESIHWQEQTLVFIIRAGLSPASTTFLTPDEFNFQLGFVVYPAGGEVKRHLHKKLVRQIVGTSEVIMVRKGQCEIDIYNDDRELIATRRLGVGDLVLTVNGGHSFRMQEDTVLLEVKQGPYTGTDEKEQF